MSGFQVIQGDAQESLAALESGSVHCVVTSPPYWGLRDYGEEGQLGLEETPDLYVERMVEVFAEARRVLRDDGTLWLNLGDSYAANRGYQVTDSKHTNVGNDMGSSVPHGLKPKDLVGIPWRVAFALQADGWYLRSDIVWSKPNPMPESVRDRPTRAHEYIFLLSKSQRYYYDAEAIAEAAETLPQTRDRHAEGFNVSLGDGRDRWSPGARTYGQNGTRNKRTVWTVATQPYSEAHFATFPTKLIEPCVLAGCPEGGTVLDPFAGAGTTGMVALRASRDFLGIELNPEYVEMARNRILDDAPLLNREADLTLQPISNPREQQE